MRELIDKSTVNISKTIGGQNDFADCIRESVKAVIDNAETVTEQEIVKPCFERLKQVMKERNEDNGGEPLNAVDKGYNLAFKHMCLEIDKILSEQEKDEQRK